MPSFYRIMFCLLLISVPQAAWAHFDLGVKAQSFGGAFRGVADAEDIVFSNPAGLIKHRRTAFDVFYQLAVDPRYHRLGAVVGDAQTSAWGLGLGYVAGIDSVKERPLTHQLNLALAMPIVTDIFALGLSGSYFYDWIPKDDHAHFFNMDAAFMINAPVGLAFAVVLDHIVPKKGREKPMGLALASAFDVAMLTEVVPLTVSLDWLMDDVQSDHDLQHVFATGMQYKAFSLLAVRLGYKAEVSAKNHYLSMGSGLITEVVSIDGVYQQHLTIGKTRYFGMALTFSI